MNLFIDTETFSPIPLAHGLARYATQVEVMIVTWAIDDGPVHIEDLTGKANVSHALLIAAQTCDRAIAHGAQFDRTVIGVNRLPLAAVLAGKWYCTLAAALRHGLPGGLDKLSTVLRLSKHDAKIDGRRLIQVFCKPNADGTRNTRETHPALWQDFLTYAAQDITAMREVYRKLPKWNDTPFLLSLWDLDQTINARGIAVDVEFAEAAVRATTTEQARLATRTATETYGTVQKATQRDQLLRFLLVEHGVDLPDLKADTIERRLTDPELPEYVKSLLRLRQSASKSSTSKYRTMLQHQVNGRLYFLLQIWGAQRTGRYAGRTVQPQNLYRPTLKFHEIETAIEAVKAGVEDILLDDIMEAMASCIRSALIAGPGKKLVVSDLANIEGRILAWIAGEEWKLQAYRDYDAGTGPDLYVQTYARSFGVEIKDVTKGQRQIGKTQELALGYQGGVGAFVTMAASLGIDLDALAFAVTPTLPTADRLHAEGMWQWAGRKGRSLGLSKDVYVACSALVSMWREAQPATYRLWTDAENAARSAILNEGVEYTAGRLVFDRKGQWLRMRLPSGRYLCYPNPKLEGEGQTIKYAAWNVYKKAWHHESTYGGKLVENGCQGIAMDVLAEGMVRAEKWGYPIVLDVHDELVTEVPDDPNYCAKYLSAQLATGGFWTVGLPLAAKGFESARYRKED